MPQAIMWIGVTSTSLDSLELSDFLKRVYVDRLSTVPGVANVYLGGERRYAMRIWVDRPALAARGLTVQDLETAIKRQNVELPGGRIESVQREFTVKTDSRLATPGGVRAGDRHQQERLSRPARRGGAGRGRRRRIPASSSINPAETAIGMGIVRQSTANTLVGGRRRAQGTRRAQDRRFRPAPRPKCL